MGWLRIWTYSLRYLLWRRKDHGLNGQIVHGCDGDWSFYKGFTWYTSITREKIEKYGKLPGVIDLDGMR